MMMEIAVAVDKESFRRKYLELMNGVMKLTPRELDVLEVFLSIDDEVACSKMARKQVVEQLNFKSVSVLNNYVKGLKDKGVILVDKHGVYRYHPITKGKYGLPSVTFKFVST